MACPGRNGEQEATATVTTTTKACLNQEASRYSRGHHPGPRVVVGRSRSQACFVRQVWRNVGTLCGRALGYRTIMAERRMTKDSREPTKLVPPLQALDGMWICGGSS